MISNGDTLAMKQSPSSNPFAVVVERRLIVKSARRVGVFYTGTRPSSRLGTHCVLLKK
jgi:hypothetical protein